jgi:glutathione S-transferase
MRLPSNSQEYLSDWILILASEEAECRVAPKPSDKLVCLVNPLKSIDDEVVNPTHRISRHIAKHTNRPLCTLRAAQQSPQTQSIHTAIMASYTNGESNNGETKGIQPKITLYTNHLCPFAHRAHITLEELGLDFEEVIIDLDKPREQWYLDINPRGLVPSIKYTVPGLYDEEIITESSIVAQFLADARPSHLLPGSLHDPFAPLFRARLAFFVDTWNTKVQGNLYPMMKAEGEEKEKLANETVAAIEKEIEPLLANAAPFFGGKDKPTLAEVCFI